MTAELGHMALVLAFCVACLQAALPLYGAHRNQARLMEFGDRAAIGQFLLLAIKPLKHSLPRLRAWAFQGFKQIVLCTLTLFFVSSHALASSDGTILEVNGRQTMKDLRGHIDFYEDENWENIITDMLGKNANKFSPVLKSEPDFGYVKSKIWLRVKVKNTNADSNKWRLHIFENFMQYIDVYSVGSNGDIDHLLSHNLDTKFTDRQILHPELVTPIILEPNETTTIVIAYVSGGSSHLAFSLETLESFSINAVKRTSKNFISYGMMLILILASVLALIILQRLVFLAYLGYVVTTLLYLIHADGFTFQYLWPQVPRFNANFSIIVGMFFIAATYNFARVFLRTKTYHPRADKVLLGLLGLSLLITIPAAFIEPQLTKKSMMPLILLAIFAGTCCGILAALTRFREVRFYLFAWCVGIFTAGLMNMRHILGFDISQDTTFDSIRVAIVLDAIMMGLGVADGYRQILKSKQKATEKNLANARQNLRLNDRLYKLEEQYRLAIELAASRGKQMQNTVHDLMQPLHALRVNVQNLKDATLNKPDDTANIDRTFLYLENLIRDCLQNSDVVEGDDETTLSLDLDLSVSKVLTSIYEMFLPDTQKRGLTFHYTQTKSDADIAPLALMRIVTNLVSNAIKYTPSGSIHLSAIKRDESLCIEVRDTGVGMTDEEFSQAQLRNVRLAKTSNVEGQGYGLAIAFDLVKKHGLKLYKATSADVGTTIVLEIPNNKLN